MNIFDKTHYKYWHAHGGWSEKLLICFILFYSVAAVFMTTSVQSGKMTFSDKTSNKTAARS